MKLLLRLLWTLGLLQALAAAQDAGSAQLLFERANDAYRRGAYEEAELGWQALLEVEGLHPRDRARIALGLGNAAWRTDRPMAAVGWYTVATRLDPRHADARANLELARTEAGLEPDDRGDLRSTVRRILQAPRPAERRWAVLVAALLLSGALVGEALRGGVLWRRAGVLLAVVFALSCVPWLYGMVQRPGDDLLVVGRPSVSLRSEPRAGLAAIGAVPAGTTVKRVDELSGWVRIETEDGRRGWVPEGGVFGLVR